MKLRINETKENRYNFPFKDSQDVYSKMKEYAKADREMFMVMYLTAKNQVIDCELNSIGMVDSAAVYPKEVFRGALLANACSIICVHNHPSGDVTPSAGDDDITNEIVKAGVILQVRLLDHVIMGAEGYYSYADEGKLEEMEAKAGKKSCSHGGVADSSDYCKDKNEQVKKAALKVLKSGLKIPPSDYCCSALLYSEDNGLIVKKPAEEYYVTKINRPFFVFKKTRQLVMSCPFCRTILIKK